MPDAVFAVDDTGCSSFDCCVAAFLALVLTLAWSMSSGGLVLVLVLVLVLGLGLVFSLDLIFFAPRPFRPFETLEASLATESKEAHASTGP